MWVSEGEWPTEIWGLRGLTSAGAREVDFVSVGAFYLFVCLKSDAFKIKIDIFSPLIILEETNV